MISARTSSSSSRKMFRSAAITLVLTVIALAYTFSPTPSASSSVSPALNESSGGSPLASIPPAPLPPPFEPFEIQPSPDDGKPPTASPTSTFSGLTPKINEFMPNPLGPETNPQVIELKGTPGHSFMGWMGRKR